MPALRRLIPALLLSWIFAPAATVLAQPQGPAAATDSMVYIQTTSAEGPSRSCIGVCIAPDQVLISATAIDRALSATATLTSCEKFDVAGLLAVDEQSDLAILKVAATPGRLKPLTLAISTPPSGIPVIVDMVIR